MQSINKEPLKEEMSSLKVYYSCFTRILHTHGHRSVQALVSIWRQYSKHYLKEAG